MFIAYCIAAFVSLIVFGFLMGVTGWAADWNKDDRYPGESSPPEVAVCFAAVVWPLTLLFLACGGVIDGGQWLRRRIQEELADERGGE